MKDKEKQRELIVGIMKADEQSGIYATRKQTAVDWLLQILSGPLITIPKDIKEKAKQMEKEQIEKAFKSGAFYDGYELQSKQYYWEEYENKL